MRDYGIDNIGLIDMQPDPLERILDPVIDANLLRDHSMADYAYEVILDRIKEFEEELDDEHEVAVRLASFGQSITMSVTSIGYANPSTLVFYGYVGGQRATLIQHMNQLNFLLMAVQKADPAKPPRRIGFERPDEEP